MLNYLKSLSPFIFYVSMISVFTGGDPIANIIS